MEIIVLTDECGKKELQTKKSLANYTVVNTFQQLREHKTADALLILTDKYAVSDLQQLPPIPVFIHLVNQTLYNLNLTDNFIRINAWPTFIQRDCWEVAGNEHLVKKVFETLGWKFTMVSDTPGMVAARIVAMIINEAYFAFGENVSTKEDIDTAMKLGTNYPYGPFEWTSKIGLDNITSLLIELTKVDTLYKPAPALLDEFSKLNN